jgi:hypothetical protein
VDGVRDRGAPGKQDRDVEWPEAGIFQLTLDVEVGLGVRTLFVRCQQDQSSKIRHSLVLKNWYLKKCSPQDEKIAGSNTTRVFI